MRLPQNPDLKSEISVSSNRKDAAFKSPRLVIGLFLITVFILLAVFAPVIAPKDPTSMYPGFGYLKPAWLRADDEIPGYWLGSDRYGRDVFSRLVYGSRASIFLALTAAPLAALIGTLIGVSAGFAGGRMENILMRLTDVFSAFPSIMFSVLMVLILRNRPIGFVMNGLLTLTIAFATVAWVTLARLLRSVVLELRQRQFVEAATALGATDWGIIKLHIIPNVSGLIATWIVNAVPSVILLEAGLGYLGVDIVKAVEGNEFQVTSWGGLFLDGRGFLHFNPFILLASTLCVLLISLGFSLLAEFLNQRFFPERDMML